MSDGWGNKMMKSPLRLFALLAASTLLVILMFRSYINIQNWHKSAPENAQKRLTGYCYGQDRYLSNQELTDLAVGVLLENLQTRYETLSESEKANTIYYSSIEEFHQINSECCPIITKPGDLEFAKARIKKFKRHGTYDIIGNSISSHIYYQLEKSGEKNYRTYRYSMRFCGDHIGPHQSKHAIGNERSQRHY